LKYYNIDLPKPLPEESGQALMIQEGIIRKYFKDFYTRINPFIYNSK
jgi:hypothetical protein